MYLRLSDEIKIYQSYNQIILHYIHDGQIMFFEENESGKEVLLLCNGTKTFEEIVTFISEKNRLMAEQINGVEKYIRNHMKSGIILESSCRKQIQIEYFDYIESVIPAHLSVEVTNVCNLRCNHCFNNSGEGNGIMLSWESMKEIIDTGYKMGIPLLYITGGEPFTYPHIQQVLSYANRKFRNITLATNAYNLKGNIKCITETQNCVLQISIDGLEEKHNHIRGRKDAFRKTITNIKELVKAGIPICVYFTLNENNFKDMEAVVQLAKELGCRAIKIGAVLKIGRAEKNDLTYNEQINYRIVIKELAEKYSDDNFVVLNEKMDIANGKQEDDICLNKCGGGYKTIYINSDGRITMCATMQKIVIGNVNNNSLENCLKSKIIKKAKNIPTPSQEVCGSCKFLEKCNGCIARIFEHTEEECELQKHEIFKEMCN